MYKFGYTILNVKIYKMKKMFFAIAAMLIMSVPAMASPSDNIEKKESPVFDHKYSVSVSNFYQVDAPAVVISVISVFEVISAVPATSTRYEKKKFFSHNRKLNRQRKQLYGIDDKNERSLVAINKDVPIDKLAPVDREVWKWQEAVVKV